MEGYSLTTAEVAERLGVKPATVYAYVSRGLLTRSRGSRRAGSRFSAAEVDRLAASRRTASVDAPRGVAETVASRITLLTDDGLWFRGHPVAELAATADLATVATLLWPGAHDGPGADDRPGTHDGPGTGPVRFVPAPDATATARRVVAELPAGARLADRLRVAVSALAAADPWRFDLAPEAVTRTGAALVGSLLAVLAPEPGPGVSTGPGTGPGTAAASPGARLWPALTTAAPTAAGVADLDAALVLLADHGLAASTLTARVAASARAHVYAVVSAGLGALDGPFHGTAATAASRLLGDALAGDPAAVVADRLRAGEHLPGFGHSVYTVRDPRAQVLLGRLASTGAGAAAHALAAVVTADGTRPGRFPNVDLGLAALTHAHGLRPDAAETVFALARIVGWVAHACEEYAEPGLRFRVRGRYVGEPPRRPDADDAGPRV